jgi:hypothetical protein
MSNSRTKPNPMYHKHLNEVKFNCRTKLSNLEDFIEKKKCELQTTGTKLELFVFFKYNAMNKNNWQILLQDITNASTFCLERHLTDFEKFRIQQLMRLESIFQDQLIEYSKIMIDCRIRKSLIKQTASKHEET